MMPEERVSPREVKGRRPEETEIIRMFIEDVFAIYQMSKEVICQTATKDFCVALWRERRLQNGMDSGLDRRSAFVKTEATYSLGAAMAAILLN